ncbi:MAG: DNA alkylation repair protein [Anaeromyxobacteraceae bacterium]
MAPELKHFFDARVVGSVADDLRRVHRSLDREAFLAECLDGLGELELLARAWRIAEVMHRHLPARFPAAARVIVASLGPPLGSADTFGMEPFRHLPHVFYVSRHGLDHFEPSMAALRELTRRFTSEYGIRPFLERHPARTLERLRTWARDPDVHVRRLVSEGTRPRLPWAPRLRALQADPAPGLALLELLRDDPERYVQRSVANHLNDVGKDHPGLLVETCRRWSVDASPGRRWIVGHALRSLVKKGDRGALAVLGFGKAAPFRVEKVRLAPRRVRVGGRLTFSLDLVNPSRRPASLLVDYAVHFVKAPGEARPKVFKLRRVELPAGGRVALRGTVSFAPMTTRRHHPGRHRIDLLVNGVARPLGAFHVDAEMERPRSGRSRTAAFGAARERGSATGR